MSSMLSKNALWRLVAAREVKATLRDKGFLGGTAFMLVLVVAIFVVMQVIGARGSTHEVAVVDDLGARAAAASAEIVKGADSDNDVTTQRFDSAADAETAVRDGDVDAALLATDGGYELVTDADPDDELRSAMSAAVASTVLDTNAQQQNVDLAALQEGTALQERSLDPDADTAGERSGVAFAFALMFYVTALSFGMMISQSVVQEKESRVVEILAAAVPIRALLWGKIFGNTLLGLAQIVLVVAVGLAGMALTGRTELLEGVGPAAAWYVGFFVLGFVTLASLWSVAGSMASRQQDLQSTTLPGQVLLFAPYLLAVVGGGQVKVVMSMMPIVSTMTMPGRIVEGEVPLWQIGVAILTTVAAAVLFVRIGSRVYERTLLKTDRSVGYREALTSKSD